jgi:PAS domain S-box-containing protein
MKTRRNQSGHSKVFTSWPLRQGSIVNVPYEAATQKKHLKEKALPASRKEATDLKAALDEHAIVAITDPRGLITFVNDKFCAISKYSRDELLGQDLRIINSGYHTKDFFRNLWSTITQGSTWHGDIKNRAKDGSFYWEATTIVPFLDKRGKPLQFVALYADIAAQKRLEAELDDKLRLQRLLAELFNRFVTLPSERVDAAIEEAQRLIVETLELDRSTLWQIAEHGQGLVCTHCWQRPGWPSVPPRFTTDGTLPWAQATLMRGDNIFFSSVDDLPPEAARDAEIFRLHGLKSNLTLPLIANGRVFGAVAFSTLGMERSWRQDEIAEMKLVAQIIGNVIGRERAELREEQMRGELAHAMRTATLGELAAALTHELNQPLAAILSNAQAARRFIADEAISFKELRAILDDIVRDDKRAGGVIQNLRAMVSKRPTVREACCLNELVCEVMELLHAEVLEERIELRPAFAPALPQVQAARVELQQVLVNLLINALHAMKEAPLESRFIEIETRAEPGAVVVSIRDRGHGIPPERLAHVFDPFFSTKSDGMGMGLSICRRIIENHAGRIAAQNHDDGGASFSFALPIPAGVPA